VCGIIQAKQNEGRVPKRPDDTCYEQTRFAKDPYESRGHEAAPTYFFAEEDRNVQDRRNYQCDSISQKQTNSNNLCAARYGAKLVDVRCNCFLICDKGWM
jgi:hypothetical protein